MRRREPPSYHDQIVFVVFALIRIFYDAVSGALLVFIWTFADFITPLVLGVQDLLAPQAYLNIVQFVDRRIFRMGIVISALLVILAILFVLAARQYVAVKDYSSLAYTKIQRRRLRRECPPASGPGRGRCRRWCCGTGSPCR